MNSQLQNRKPGPGDLMVNVECDDEGRLLKVPQILLLM